MKTLDEINGAVDFLRCHGATRSADMGQWRTDSIPDLGSDPEAAAKELRRALHRADISSGKKRWLDGGRIGG